MTPPTCTSRLADRPDGLRCVRPSNHEHGHVFWSSTGSDVDDHHEDGGHG